MWLLKHRAVYAARDAVWRDLVTRERNDGPEWMIATVGMAMPALVRFAGSLARGYRGDPSIWTPRSWADALVAITAKLDQFVARAGSRHSSQTVTRTPTRGGGQERMVDTGALPAHGSA
jgi:hypothetical protein